MSAHRLDHIGIERSLREKLGAAEFLRLLVEHVDEGGADPLALFLGVGDAGQPGQKQLAGIAVDQRDVVVAAEQVDHLFSLAGAQQAGIDKDAGQLVADRLVQQRRGDRGIDPARQPADDPAVADPVADLRRSRRARNSRHRPVAAAARDLVGEIAQQFRALRRVRHLGVKQKAVKPPLVIGDRGIGCGVAGGHRAEAGWQRLDLVAVAHPHLGATAAWATARRTAGSRRECRRRRGRIPDARSTRRDRPTRRTSSACHSRSPSTGTPSLNAIAGARGELPSVTEAGPPDRMIARGSKSRTFSSLDRIGMDLAIDPALAHAAGDQLGDLAAEIEDQDAVGHGKWSSGISRVGKAERRSNTATKKPSVPCRAGVRNR